MGTGSQQPVTQFTELGDPVAAASNYTELKNEGSLVQFIVIVSVLSMVVVSLTIVLVVVVAVYSSVFFDPKQQRFVNKVHSSVQGDGHLLPPPLKYIADSLYVRLLHIIANIGDICPAYQFLK